jgi:hypothetical protein
MMIPPLYTAPPAVKPEDVPSGVGIFEHKRNLHWVRNNIVLDLLMLQQENATANAAKDTKALPV